MEWFDHSLIYRINIFFKLAFTSKLIRRETRLYCSARQSDQWHSYVSAPGGGGVEIATVAKVSIANKSPAKVSIVKKSPACSPRRWWLNTDAGISTHASRMRMIGYSVAWGGQQSYRLLGSGQI